MKRFLLFAGPYYYPAGGWGDFQGDFDSIVAARRKLIEIPGEMREWLQIIDSQTGEEVDIDKEQSNQEKTGISQDERKTERGFV